MEIVAHEPALSKHHTAATKDNRRIQSVHISAKVVSAKDKAKVLTKTHLVLYQSAAQPTQEWLEGRSRRRKETETTHELAFDKRDQKWAFRTFTLSRD